MIFNKTKITVLLVLFAFLSISFNVSGYEMEPIWTEDDWNLRGPSNIHSDPVPSHAGSVLYLTGDNGDGVNKFYSVDFYSGSPEPTSIPIDGKTTSSTRVYPEAKDDNIILRQWTERVYFMTEEGTIYRIEGDTLELGWSYEISDFDYERSYSYTPVIHETQEHIILVFLTGSSVIALEDQIGTDGPEKLWTISLERDLIYNQPEVVRSMGGRETTLILTTTCGHIKAIDINGDILWDLQLEDSDSRPVVPLDILMGIRRELYFFTTGESHLNRIPVKENTVIQDVESIKICEEHKLQTPLISEDGNIIWVAAVSESHSVIHYLELGKLFGSNDYNEWREHNIDDEVVGELVHMEQRSLLIVLTSSGKLHGLVSDPTSNREQWKFQLHSESTPEYILLISRYFSPHFIDHVAMVVFAGEHGSEAWDLYNLPTDMSFLFRDRLDDIYDHYQIDDTQDTEDPENSEDMVGGFTLVCLISLMASWLIVLLIIGSIFVYRRRKDDLRYPPYYRQ